MPSDNRYSKLDVFYLVPSIPMFHCYLQGVFGQYWVTFVRGKGQHILSGVLAQSGPSSSKLRSAEPADVTFQAKLSRNFACLYLGMKISIAVGMT